MERTNTYDFLQLLSLIKIKLNMNFGEKMAFAHICYKTHPIFFLFFQGKWQKACVDRLNKQVRDTPWFVCLFHLVKALN
jgi:hypothetical protein